MKMFPIQGDLRTRRPKFKIPWGLADEAYLTYSKLFSRGQSLERLAERGGFDLKEFAVLFFGDNPCLVECADKHMERVRTSLEEFDIKIPVDKGVPDGRLI